jgi:hypothetical protein
MSKKDSYTTNTDEIPLWNGYEVMSFESSIEMLNWVQDDRINFTLSDKVYGAMMDCLEHGIEQVIVAIRKPNFQKILSGYTKRLLDGEKYEKLGEIKQQIQKYDLEM